MEKPEGAILFFMERNLSLGLLSRRCGDPMGCLCRSVLAGLSWRPRNPRHTPSCAGLPARRNAANPIATRPGAGLKLRQSGWMFSKFLSEHPQAVKNNLPKFVFHEIRGYGGPPRR